MNFNNISKKNQNIAICVFAIAMLLYSTAIGIYECETGGVAAKLTIEYHDYSVPISNNSAIRIAIDAFPRDIYKNTKETSYIMLACGIIGLVGVISTIMHAINKRNLVDFAMASAITNCIVILIPFCFSAFLTWKLNSLSDADIDAWDSVDSGFIDNLERAQSLLIATVIPGVVWSVIACVVYTKLD
jgi:hypothetical protein